MSTSSPQKSRPAPSLFARVRSTLSATLRAVAGAPVGVRPHRRGTFLVIVIGTLSLLAIVGLVYFAIGQGDRRTSEAMLRGDRVNAVPSEVADYIGTILAKDVTDLVPERMNWDAAALRNNTKTWLFRAETWDYPSSSWTYDSSKLSTGRSFSDPNPPPIEDSFVYFTPWGRGDDPFLASLDPTWLNPTNATHSNPDKAYLENLDWAHISNIAPDGRYVNLFNLRNNFNSPAPRWNGNPIPINKGTISDNLTLPNGSTKTDFNAAVDMKFPTFFSDRQVGGFRPTNATYPAKVNTRDYPFYQWADADGSGFFNARWQELIDARGAAPTSVLGHNDNIRWFVASRVIDLSGLINVNTAMDTELAPTKLYRLGLRPADIDLVRLLSYADAFEQGGPNGGPNSFFVPSADTGKDLPYDYSKVDSKGFYESGQLAYSMLQKALTEKLTPVAANSASGAFPKKTTIDPKLRTNNYDERAQASEGVYLAGGKYQIGGIFPLEDTVELLTRHGINNPGFTSLLERVMGGYYTNLSDSKKDHYSPLRDNRPLEAELFFPKAVSNSNILVPSQIAANSPTDRALLQHAIDPRHRITTVSAARQLNGLSARPGDTLTAAESGKLAAKDLTVPALFARYADALLPAAYANVPGVWSSPRDNLNKTDYDQMKALSYGHQGAQLPYLISAFLATNFVAISNADSLGTAQSQYALPYTLVYDRSVLNTGSNATALYSSTVRSLYSNFTGVVPPLAPNTARILKIGNTSNAAKSDMPSVRLPSGQNDPVSKAKLSVPLVNVFPITPQPVITKVSSMTVLTDMPKASGGDVDDKSSTHVNITIDGRTDESSGNNPDLLFRFVVVQITNPFDATITLSSPTNPTVKDGDAADTDSEFYYIELTGATQDPASPKRAYKLVNFTADPTGKTGSVAAQSIGPGQTLNVILLDRSPARIEEQMNAALGLGSGGWDAAAVWVRRSLTSSNATSTFALPTTVPKSPATSGYAKVDIGSYKPFFAPDEKGTVVQLWKSVRSDFSKVVPGGGTDALQGSIPVHNDPLNDHLVDRFKLPPAETLDRHSAVGSGVSSEVIGAPTDDEGKSPNTGVTTALVKAFSRPSDGTAKTAMQTVPAFAIASKANDDAHLMVKEVTVGVPDTYTVKPGDSLVLSVITANGGGAMTPTEFFSADPIAYYQGMAAPLLGDTKYVPPISGPSRFATSGANNAGLLKELYLSNTTPFKDKNNKDINKSDRRLLRATDLLLPMGVGPMEAPLMYDSGGTIKLQADADKHYTTLPEALGAILGYSDQPSLSETFAASLSPEDPLNFYCDAPKLPGMTVERSVLDFGNVKLYDFAPYYKPGNKGQFDYSQGSRTFGLGVPLAANIADIAAGVVPPCNDPNNPNLIQTPAAGLLNVSTAPIENLRCLPLFAPPNPNEGGPGKHKSPLAPDRTWSNSIATETTDIATTLIAYRDKSNVFFREASQVGNVKSANFFDRTTANSPRMINNINDPKFLNGRRLSTEIDGVHEEPGLRSIGELFCLHQTNANVPRNHACNIDFPAFNSSGITIDGIDSVYYGSSGTRDTIVGEFDQRLAVVESVANSVTTRSDLFAAWFVLHGYTKNDCENLGDNDPLVPSIAKRFLVIYDRSNVTSADTKPRILVFRELPYR